MQDNRALLKLPSDGFVNPSARVSEAVQPGWNRSGHLPRGILERHGRDKYPVRRVDRCSATRSFGKQDSARLPWYLMSFSL
jgi:hypothetical protein